MTTNDDNNIIVYEEEESIIKVNVRFSDEDVWLTQNQLANIYDTTQQNIAFHIKNIYSVGKLVDCEATHKCFLSVRREGNREVERKLSYYSLDMIIAIGYRVQSEVAIRFSRWAREQLNENGRNCDLISQTLLSPEEKERIKDRNRRYWEDMTDKASDAYKNKMWRLSTAETDEETCLLKSFRRDDSFLGIPAPHHIMYKLDHPLKSKDGQRAYEFLIEYDIYEPTVGIYYGCKGLTLKGNHDQQIEIFINEWKEIEGKLAYILTATFPGKEFSPRLRQTNNANNNTYWPFWITLYEEEDIVGVAARAIHIIREVYKNHFDLQETLEIITPECVNLDKKEPVEYKRKSAYFNTDTAFTEPAYKKLLESLKNDTCRTNFEKLINSLMNDRAIHAVVNSYEKAYAIDCDGTEFAYLILAFIDYLKIKKHCKNISPPWTAFTNVFLNKDEMCFSKDGLKNLINKDKNNLLHKKHLNEANERLKITNDYFT